MTIYQKFKIGEALWKTPAERGEVPVEWRSKVSGFETKRFCKEQHRMVVNACRKLEFQCEEISTCAPKRRCGSGLCPHCMRRAREYLLNFASHHRLFRLKWQLVTIRVNGWTKAAGDISPIGPLSGRPDILGFLTRLRGKRWKGLLAIGAIEAAFTTVDNLPVGKVFHLHLLISGPAPAQIKSAAAASFDLDTSNKNNPDIRPVAEGLGNFFRAFSYAFKQPLAKKSKRHTDDPGVRQTPKSNELRELMSNYGEHRVEDRLILEGFEWKQGCLRRISTPQPDQIWLLPMPAKAMPGTGGSGEVGVDEKINNDEQIGIDDKMGNNGLLLPVFPANIDGKGGSTGGVHPVHPDNHSSDDPLPLSTIPAAAPHHGDIELLRLIEDNASGEHQLDLRFLKLDGSFGEAVIARRTLASVQEFKQFLIGRGAAASIDFKQEAQCLLATDPPIHVQATDRPGWYGDCFVCDLGVFGQTLCGQTQIELNSMSIDPRGGHSEGSARECADEIGEFVAASDFLALTYLCALLPPLAARVGETQGFVVNLVGKSSTGKTLALRLCQSVFAKADERDLQTFNHTAGSLPTLFSALSCTAIPFKDVKAATEKGVKAVEKFQQMVFTTHGGDARRNLNGAKVAAPTFCIPMLSDERSLAERYAMAGVELEEGDKVRCMELPVPEPSEGGVFNRVPDSEGDTGIMAQRLQALVERRYGLIFPLWVDALSLLAREELTTKFHEIADRFVERLKCGQGIEHRYAGPFGLLAAAAEIASSAGLLHDVGHIHGALERLYALGVSRMAEGDRALKKGLGSFIRASSDRSIFPLVKRGKAPDVPDAEGFVRDDGGVRLLYIKKEAFEGYFEPGLRPVHTVLPSLERTCVFLKGDKELTRPVKQSGLPRGRYLVFYYEKLVAVTKPS